MKTLSSVGLCGRFVCAFVAVAMILSAPLVRAADLPPVAKPAVSTPVTITDNGTTWTMDNGIVKATILKNNGNMQTIMYHGVSIVGRSEYWEQTPSGQITASVTIDPAKNGGERGEVAVKGAGPDASILKSATLWNAESAVSTPTLNITHPATNGAAQLWRKPLHPSDEPHIQLALGR